MMLAGGYDKGIARLKILNIYGPPAKISKKKHALA
jgi:hypothetical protein